MNSLSRKSFVRFLLAVVITLLFVALLYSGRESLVSVWREANRWLLVGALGALTVSNVGAAFLFALLMKRDRSIGQGRAWLAGVFLFSQLAKYVPGRIWSLATQSAMMRSGAVVPRLLEANLELAGIVVIFSTGIGFALVAGIKMGYGVAVVLMMTLCLLVAREMSSAWFSVAIRRIARAVPRIRLQMASPLADERPTWRAADRLCLYAGLMTYMAGYVSGWFLLVLCLPQQQEVAATEIVAGLSLSYVVGMLSFLPAGIGAREGAFVLLAPLLNLPVGTMAAIAVASRAVLVVVDGIGALAGYALIATGRRLGHA